MTDRDAKVKYRGIQIKGVHAIDYRGDQATLTLAIERSQLHYIPPMRRRLIGGTTIFGSKSVEFLPPKDPAATSLRPGDKVHASQVQLEVNTLFQTLTDLLNKIDPVNLNALSALSEGLRGNGDNPATLSGLNTYLAQLNPHLPALNRLRQDRQGRRRLCRRRP